MIRCMEDARELLRALGPGEVIRVTDGEGLCNEFSRVDAKTLRFRFPRNDFCNVGEAGVQGVGRILYALRKFYHQDRGQHV